MIASSYKLLRVAPSNCKSGYKWLQPTAGDENQLRATASQREVTTSNNEWL